MTESSTSTLPRLALAPLWYALGGGLLLLVAMLSLLPVPNIGVNDKVSHVVTYLVLGTWFSLLVRRTPALAWVIFGLTAYGGLIELLQGLTGYRTADWADLLANSIGLCAGSLLYFSPLRRILQFVDARLLLLFKR